MMTQHEREAAFIQAVHEAEAKFGCTAIAVTEARKYGEAVMIEAKVLVVPMANWNPPPEPPAPEATPPLTDVEFAQQLMKTSTAPLPEQVKEVLEKMASLTPRRNRSTTKSKKVAPSQ